MKPTKAQTGGAIGSSGVSTSRSAVGPQEGRIGTGGDEVRAMNFAGGGFDTVMQLGVVHALLVAQGKAPDAVVGISASAANAVTLAEVMQAGEELERGWEDLPRSACESGPMRERRNKQRELHENRLKARVARFREILHNIYHSRDDVVDALLPDTYQIDSNEPLQPLSMPISVKEERKRRLDAIANHAGLVRLYNDLLGLRLSVGTMTRGIRRILGLTASHEVRTLSGRLVVCSLEIVRLWILLGTSLFGIAPLVPILLSPYVCRQRIVRGATAGALIFRFRAITRISQGMVHLVCFFAILSIWVWVTLAVLLLPYHASQLLGLSPMLVYGIVLTLPGAVFLRGWRSLLAFDRTDWSGLLHSMFHGCIALLTFLGGWIALCLLAAFTSQLCIRLLAATDEPARRAWVGTTSALSWAVTSPYASAIAIASVVAATAAAIMALRVQPGRHYLRRLLNRYCIKKSIFHPYALEQFFSRVFDQGYFGRTCMEEVVEDSLADATKPSNPKRGADGESDDGRKSLSFYSPADRRPGIHIGLGVASLDSGKVGVVSENNSVVDGLVAATAKVPFFPPKKLDNEIYVDAATVANEPMEALFSLLRDPDQPTKDRLHPNAKILKVYSVDVLPFSRKDLFREPRSMTEGLVEIALDALQLQRFRDATLERRFTELYTKVIPQGSIRAEVKGRTYLRAWVVPIEPDEPIELRKKILGDRGQEVRELINQAIADGCRAAMQVMIGPSLRGTELTRVDCKKALNKHFDRRAECAEKNGVSIRHLTSVAFPGSSDSFGAGLPEICRHCAIERAEDKCGKCGEGTAGNNGTSPAQQLDIKRLGDAASAWPHEREAPEVDTYVDPAPPDNSESRIEPSEEQEVKPPTISLLFSGGVFRGVFQLGVLNALSELGIKPRVIAGASVGSITAAMSARVLTSDKIPERRRRLRRLAAVYLALDRIILSDRFADFIRNLTVRAADARFSIRQADRVFRKFDEAGAGRYGKEARVVMAGLERLLYISPFELERLVKAVRDRRFREVARQLRQHCREWLERMGVGAELMGAEPLARLIREYVTAGIHASYVQPPVGASFDSIWQQYGVRFLATATNFTTGSLNIIGDWPESGGKKPWDANVEQGLLASSAFPAVFRPRSSNEVYPGLGGEHQFIDGGIMDNFPVDAVVQYLLRAADAADEEKIVKRPKVCTKDAVEVSVPHLIFSASLEPRVRNLDASRKERREAWLESWPEVMTRVRELGYNRKVDKWASSQEILRELTKVERARLLVPLDLEILVVKPEWLCGTFAFHPMLGFRRENQARSIAHGCASTMLRFAALKERGKAAWLTGWGVDGTLPQEGELGVAQRRWSREKRAVSPTACWLRPGCECPFSSSVEGDQGPQPCTDRELSRIHMVCQNPSTHR